MLNRRTLRVKVMQALFAYEQCKSADFSVGLQEIEEAFAPDLNSMEVQDPELLAKEKLEALELFKNHLHSGADVSSGTNDTNDSILQMVNKTISNYHDYIKRDLAQAKRTMLQGPDRIQDHFLKILNLLQEFGRMAETGVGFRKSQHSAQHNFAGNSILKVLADSAQLEEKLKTRNLSWSSNMDIVRDWFREIISKSEEYRLYLELEKPTTDDDYEIINHIIRKIIFRNDTILSFWENLDMNWAEDSAIVRSMINKTIKSITESKDEFELASLSYNWDEDLDFFEKLFDETAKNELFLQELVAQKTKNWEFERIAYTDRLILMMAVCEMMNFPSIPIKVTINEYIEVSKNYSTPKSKQFVNGVLDVIALDLQEKGLIKKSGRGLIDNK